MEETKQDTHIKDVLSRTVDLSEQLQSTVQELVVLLTEGDTPDDRS